MSMHKLEDYGAYQKSRQLFGHVVEDCELLRAHPETRRLVWQQIASADSTCSNMEEGSGRWSENEFVQYLVVSRGSAVETRGRYERLGHWLPADIVSKRVQLCDEIIGILTATINNFKRRLT